MRQDPHEQQAMQPLVSAFRQAMDMLDVATRQSKEWLDADRVRQSYESVSQLAQTLVHQFANQSYELAALRGQLEETRLASQKLKTQFDYREKREAILEQAYVETQLALQSSEMLLKRSEEERMEARKSYTKLAGMHATLVEEHGELKAENEQLKIGMQSAERFLEEERKLGKLTSDELDDVKKELALKRDDNTRIRMLARNRRMALLEVGQLFDYLNEKSMLLVDDLKWKGQTFNQFLQRLADVARPVDYRTGEALEDRKATAEQLNNEGAILPLTRKQYIPDVNLFGDSPASDTPEPEYIGVDLAPGPSHTVIVDGMFIDAQPEHEVAEQLGYSKRAHDFPDTSTNPFCNRCGQQQSEAGEFCEGQEADDNGVHLAAQITSVAEAIENGQH